MSEDQTMSAPSIPTDEPRPVKPTSKTKADLQRENADLKDTVKAMEERMSALEARGIDPNPAPIQSATPEPEVASMRGSQNQKAIRTAMGQPKRLDADKYIRAYPGKQLMWINDMNGDVQRWIDVGAEPVPVKGNDSRTFEGITDRHESKWVRSVGGDDGMGNHFWVYLMMIDPDTYEDVKTAPLRERQAHIKAALRRGRDQSDGAGEELESYAPNLPTGGQGFEQIQDHLTGKV